MKKLQMLVLTIFAEALLAMTAPLANAQLTFNLLHAFTGVPDGNFPQGILIQDENGNLYGTTAYGGNGGANCTAFGVVGGCGTVFKIDQNGQYTVLYAFLGGNDGAAPRAGVTRDAAGNLYGTTQGQGTVGAPSTVFKVDPSGNETVLHILTNPKSGGSADSTPVLDAAGNLYGTTPGGGGSGTGHGVVYKYGAHGGFSIVHTFVDIADGAQPHGGLVIDASGNLYGAAVIGGDELKSLTCYYNSISKVGCGTIFKITPSGEFSVLYHFHGRKDGGNPVSVVLDPAGNLYGITDSGGNANCYAPLGCGTIFEINSKGKFSVLYTLNPDHPVDIVYDNLFRDSNGNLYSLNQYCPFCYGYLFELDTNGNYSVLYTFGTPISDGIGPFGAMIAPNGDFYGTLLTGGAEGCGDMGVGCGTVFQLTP